jgi:histidinol dehydrogenase
MIRTVDLRGATPSRHDLARAIPRAELDVAAASAAAAELIEEVRAGGPDALLAQAERFDGVRPASLRVPREAIAAAADRLRPEVREAIEESIRRVREASRAQLPEPGETTMGPGAVVGLRWQPVERVGLYVPGGKAVYPSSVIMNVVPAQVAGVPSLALVSPPQKEFGGGVHPTVLAAAALLGVEEVYAIGGAGAIGALAHGVPELGLEAVALVTGPGNVYVAAAKRLVRGIVGIDAEAGPTEILVIADEVADPVLVAADLVSQAEHDELAAAVLVTDSEGFVERVRAELGLLAESTPHGTRVRAALSGRQSAIVLVDDLAAAAAFSNAYGPEHLEIQTADPDAVLALIDSAGAIFLGAFSPVSLGDYLAGSNHVLPTGGQARFAPGLGVHTFLRPQQLVRYDSEGLREVAARLDAFAMAEDLPAHAAAALARFGGERPSSGSAGGA